MSCQVLGFLKRRVTVSVTREPRDVFGSRTSDGVILLERVGGIEHVVTVRGRRVSCSVRR